jgi:hypothetical protein
MSEVITTDDLQDYLGSGVVIDAARAQQVVDAVNASIERMTGRVWGATRTATEVYDYQPVLFLKQMDVISVSSVSRNDTALQASSYKFRSTGRLILSSYEGRFRPHYDEISVTYTYGNIDVPEDLKLAALSLAADAYNYVDEDGSQGEVTEEQIGSLRYKYASGQDSSVGKSYFATIAGYRKARL